MDGDVKTFGFESSRERQPGFGPQLNIENAFTGITIKMAMLGHVRAKMRRATVQSHLPDQSALDQRVQAVINCRHRNIWHSTFGADEYLLCRRMIAFVQQNGVHMLALWRETKTAARQAVV